MSAAQLAALLPGYRAWLAAGRPGKDAPRDVREARGAGRTPSRKEQIKC